MPVSFARSAAVPITARSSAPTSNRVGLCKSGRARAFSVPIQRVTKGVNPVVRAVPPTFLCFPQSILTNTLCAVHSFKLPHRAPHPFFTSVITLLFLRRSPLCRKHRRVDDPTLDCQKRCAYLSKDHLPFLSRL